MLLSFCDQQMYFSQKCNIKSLKSSTSKIGLLRICCHSADWHLTSNSLLTNFDATEKLLFILHAAVSCIVAFLVCLDLASRVHSYNLFAFRKKLLRNFFIIVVNKRGSKINLSLIFWIKENLVHLHECSACSIPSMISAVNDFCYHFFVLSFSENPRCSFQIWQTLRYVYLKMFLLSKI